MAAVASASAGAISSPQSSNDHATPYMPSLSLPASFFTSLPPPASFFATLFAHHQNVLQPIPVAPPVIPPPQHITYPVPPQTPTTTTAIQQQTTPHSISPVPPGIYCDLGPAVFERTSRGYTVLRFEGYSFSKISDNRTKTYWRCANRTCRAKVHTNGGRIVYVGREPHVHKPRINNNNNGMPKVRQIKQNSQGNGQFVGPSMMSTFIPQQNNNHQGNNCSSQNGAEMVPLDLRPKKIDSTSSVVIFDEDYKDLHSSSDGGAKYEESAAAKSSSSVVYCAEEEDELEIEGDDEAEINDNGPPVNHPTSVNRTPPSSPSSSTTSDSSSPKNFHSKISNSGGNNNGKMMTSPTIRQLPRSASEVELFRLLHRANLLGYYDTFVSHGGDDVQQLVEANEEEFAEILRLVDMTSKPLHVRRLQKTLAEWVANPASFRTPLTAAEIAQFCPAKTMLSVNLTPVTPSSGGGGAVTASSTSKSTTGPSSISSSTVSPRHLAAGDAVISLVMLGKQAAPTICEPGINNSNPGNPSAPMNLSIVSHTAYPTASSSSSSGSPSVFYSNNSANKIANLPIILRPVEDHSTDTATSPNGSGPVELFPGENTDSDASSFCSTNVSEQSGLAENGGGLLMLNSGHQHRHHHNYHQKSAPVVTPEVRGQIVQTATGMLAKYPDLLTLTPKNDLSNARMKVNEIQQLMNVVNMPRDQAEYIEGVQRFSKIFGRFDTKRKHPERRLSFHELTVNEAAVSLCLLIPALLTHRERLYALARETVREVFHGAETSSSPLPGPQHEQRSSFATPPPPQKMLSENHAALKRKQQQEKQTDSGEKSPSSKYSRRSVITESGEIVFPPQEAIATPPQQDPASAGDEETTAAAPEVETNNIAMALAKQFGFPDLVDELQKDASKASSEESAE